MIGLGTIINSVGIIVGGLFGLCVGGLFKREQQEALQKACGLSTIFISIAGAMEGMLEIDGLSISSGKSMLLVLCIVIGALIGELIGIERALEGFGQWLKIKTGSGRDAQFVEAFVTTTMTVCVGAMAIVGSIQDGLLGDISTLVAKTILDCTIVAIMCSSMGKGAIFSAIPVFVFQGGITVLATLISPLFTTAAISNLSLVGSVLIFCVGVNLIWGKKFNVANMLPSMVLAVGAAYLPWG